MKFLIAGFQALSILGVVSDGPGADPARKFLIASENSSKVIMSSILVRISFCTSGDAFILHALRSPCWRRRGILEEEQSAGLGVVGDGWSNCCHQPGTLVSACAAGSRSLGASYQSLKNAVTLE